MRRSMFGDATLEDPADAAEIDLPDVSDFYVILEHSPEDGGWIGEAVDNETGETICYLDTQADKKAAVEFATACFGKDATIQFNE